MLYGGNVARLGWIDKASLKVAVLLLFAEVVR